MLNLISQKYPQKTFKLVFVLIFLFPLLSYRSLPQTSFDKKETLRLMNLARTNPSKFIQDVAKPYLKENDLENHRNAKSLLRDLNKLEDLQELTFNNDLNRIAQEYAVSSGKRGIVGHGNTKARFAKINMSNNWGENCTYGNCNAKDAVMDLLLDIGVPSLGHRKNILSKDFSRIGLGYAKHKKYTCVIVMDFN